MPSEHEAEARRIVGECDCSGLTRSMKAVIGRCGACKQTDRIAAALLSAERRGIERAAEAVKRVGEYLAEDTFRGTGGRGRTAQEHGAWLAKQIEKEIRAIAGEEVPK